MCCINPIIISKHKQLQSWINMNKKGLNLCDDDEIKNKLMKGIELMNIEKEKLEDKIIQHNIHHKEKKEKRSIRIIIKKLIY